MQNLQIKLIVLNFKSNVSHTEGGIKNYQKSHIFRPKLSITNKIILFLEMHVVIF